ncbi:hypothetical protein RFI_07549 [Reticulomyxa filosa]|uniref:Uncharacterized protein n=1 Tax=Reticulomyxa filosa TaxID=46433 RepID=X6NTG2_RETFI|nr:hypothetical protein RFI_07549 [Reticulomyxa filosa]|eukprot:ETO29570.1 hypothetical protein RFI_07549 [Reticulomyxa filosa]
MAQNEDKFKLKACLAGLLKSDTHPLLEWLEHVTEEYLIESKNMIDAEDINSLCSTMLFTYKVCTSHQECVQFCEALAQQLVLHGIAKEHPEPFPVNSSCLALYHEDGMGKKKRIKIKMIIEREGKKKLYNKTPNASNQDRNYNYKPKKKKKKCKVSHVITPRKKYTVIFDGYNNVQENTNIDEMMASKNDEEHESKRSEISLKDQWSNNNNVELQNKMSELLITTGRHESQLLMEDQTSRQKKYKNEPFVEHAIDEATLQHIEEQT